MPPAPAPPRIADYELLKLIGTGSYGDVWLARSLTGHFRAVKVVARDRFVDAEPYEREFRGLKEFAAISLVETRQMALLHVGRDEAAGFFYYVMELADDAENGRTIDPATYVPNTLREVRERRTRLPAPEVVALGVELTRAVNGLHTRGLVHRDIKPSNVILVGGAPKLADIGLVAAAAEARTFVGTEGYVPPEGPGTPAGDVYAIGRVLYEIATGNDRREFPRLPENFDQLPDRRELLELNEVIIRACEPNAAQRHRDAGAVLDDLLLLQAGRSVRRLRSTERHLSRALRAAVILAIAAAVAGAGAWLAQQRADKEMAARERAEADRDALRRRVEYSANLANAQRALDNDDLSRARQLLRAAEPKAGQKDLRGFEWRALWHEAQGDPHDEIRANGAGVVALQLSPDERTLAVHDTADNVALYDTTTSKEIVRVDGMRRLAGFSGDGAWLIGADKTGATRRWSTKTGMFEEGTGLRIGTPISVVAGDKVAALSSEKQLELRVVDLAGAEETRKIDLGAQDTAEPWVLYRTAASSDGLTLVFAWRKGSGSASRFLLTSVQLGNQPAMQRQEVGRAVPAAVGVDHTGSWAFFDPKERDVPGEIWRSAGQGWEKSAGALPKDSRKCIEFESGSERVAVVARARQLAWVSHPPSNQVLKTARGHSSLISDVAIAPKFNRMFSATTDGAVFCWPLTGPPPKQFHGWDSLGGTTGVVFAPDGKAAWVPLDGKSCVLLEVTTLNQLARVEDMVYPVGIHDNVLLGVSPTAGLLRANARTGEPLSHVIVSEAPVRMAAASDNLHQVAVVDHAGNLFASDESGVRQLGQNMQRYYRIALDTEGRRLWAAVSTTRELVCYSWPDGIERWRASFPAIVTDLVLLLGEKQLLLSLEDGSLELRDTTTGALAKHFDSGSAAPQTLALLPEQNRLLVGGMEGEVTCISTETWDPIHTIPLGRDQYLHHMFASPTGNCIAVLTRNGTLHVIRTH